MAEERKKLTVPDLRVRKKAGEKVVMASIPDYPSAIWAERAGIDIAAVGDSLGMVSYGHPNTLPVTVDMMIQHALAVRRGAPNCMILVSLPYGAYATPELGVASAMTNVRAREIDRMFMSFSMAEVRERARLRRRGAGVPSTPTARAGPRAVPRKPAACADGAAASDGTPRRPV